MKIYIGCGQIEKTWQNQRIAIVHGSYYIHTLDTHHWTNNINLVSELLEVLLCGFDPVAGRGRLSVGFAAVPLEKVFQKCRNWITMDSRHRLSDVKIG